MPNVLTDWIAARFPEVAPHDFYRDLFPAGSLATKDDHDLEVRGTYDAIAVRVTPSDDGSPRAERHLILDDLRTIDWCVSVDGVIPGTIALVSPLSYAGRRPLLSKAHELYSVTFDLDGVRGVEGMEELFHEFDTELMSTGHTICPRPTYVVSSGTGLHLYYLLDEPLRMWPNVCERLRLLRDRITRRLWNKHVSRLWEEPQLESVVQSFRMVGSLSKDDRQVVRAFRTGDRVSIDYLNQWAEVGEQVTPDLRQARHTLAEARELWPDWDPDWRAKAATPPTAATKWHVKRDLYDWWCRRVEAGEPFEGNRYWCLFVATAYATKCDVPYDELSRWAYSQLDSLDAETKTETNHFTPEDVEAALSIYRNPITCKLRRDKVAEKTSLPMPVNKRNGRTREQNIRRVNAMCDFDVSMGEPERRGRPKGSGTKAAAIRAYAADHPDMSNRAIASALGVSRNTVNKWLK